VTEPWFDNQSTTGAGKNGKGQFVTVRTINKRLGNQYEEFSPGVRREGMAEVVKVDPFTATFNFTDYSGETCTEPLSRIELDWV